MLLLYSPKEVTQERVRCEGALRTVWCTYYARQIVLRHRCALVSACAVFAPLVLKRFVHKANLSGYDGKGVDAEAVVLPKRAMRPKRERVKRERVRREMPASWRISLMVLSKLTPLKPTAEKMSQTNKIKMRPRELRKKLELRKESSGIGFIVSIFFENSKRFFR